MSTKKLWQISSYFPHWSPILFHEKATLGIRRMMGLEQWARKRTPIQHRESTLEAMWQQITYMSLISAVILTTFPHFITFPDRAAQTSKLIIKLFVYRPCPDPIYLSGSLHLWNGGFCFLKNFVESW